MSNELSLTVDEVRDYAHRLGATQLVATVPTLDGAAEIDYRPGDWLKITIIGELRRSYVLTPTWRAP